MKHSLVMKHPLRIAILMCGSPMPLCAEIHGNYGGVFKVFLEESAACLRNEIPEIDNGLELTNWNVYQVEEYPRLEDIDAILMTGSGFDAFEDVPWINKLVNFVKSILAQDRIRVIGVCFGHQILARALGLPVSRNEIGWELSVTPMNLTPTGQNLFKANLKPNMLSLMQMHRDIVRVEPTALPDGVENLGSTDVCSVQGMYKKGRFISVQGHPEFTPGIVKEILSVRTELGIFTMKMYQDAMSRLRDEHDGVAVGCAFLRFLTE